MGLLDMFGGLLLNKPLRKAVLGGKLGGLGLLKMAQGQSKDQPGEIAPEMGAPMAQGMTPPMPQQSPMDLNRGVRAAIADALIRRQGRGPVTPDQGGQSGSRDFTY